MSIELSELSQAVDAFYTVAENHYGQPFKRYPISLRLKGATAGKAFLGREMRFNRVLFMENKAEFLARTVPHEIAHMIAHDLYGKVKPHGHQWKAVCINIGMKDVKRTHSYDVSNSVNRRPRPYTYRCGCKDWDMTANMHRKMSVFGRGRHCKACKQSLVYVGGKSLIAA